jgi:hypothetical protein
MKQNRFALLNRAKPEEFEHYVQQAQKEVLERYNFYSHLANEKK